jgi:hypothetical protein
MAVAPTAATDASAASAAASRRCHGIPGLRGPTAGSGAALERGDAGSRAPDGDDA